MNHSHHGGSNIRSGVHSKCLRLHSVITLYECLKRHSSGLKGSAPPPLTEKKTKGKRKRKKGDTKKLKRHFLEILNWKDGHLNQKASEDKVMNIEQRHVYAHDRNLSCAPGNNLNPEAYQLLPSRIFARYDVSVPAEAYRLAQQQQMTAYKKGLDGRPQPGKINTLEKVNEARACSGEAQVQQLKYYKPIPSLTPVPLQNNIANGMQLLLSVFDPIASAVFGPKDTFLATPSSTRPPRQQAQTGMQTGAIPGLQLHAGPLAATGSPHRVSTHMASASELKSLPPPVPAPPVLLSDCDLQLDAPMYPVCYQLHQTVLAAAEVQNGRERRASKCTGRSSMFMAIVEDEVIEEAPVFAIKDLPGLQVDCLDFSSNTSLAGTVQSYAYGEVSHCTEGLQLESCRSSIFRGSASLLGATLEHLDESSLLDMQDMTIQTASPEASLLEASLFHHAHSAHEAQSPQSGTEAMDESLAFGEVSQLQPCNQQEQQAGPTFSNQTSTASWCNSQRMCPQVIASFTTQSCKSPFELYPNRQRQSLCVPVVDCSTYSSPKEMLSQEQEYPCVVTGLEGCNGKILYAGFGLSRKSARISPSSLEFRMLDRANIPNLAQFDLLKQEEGVLYDAADENDEDEYGESKLNGCTDLDLDLQIINDSFSTDTKRSLADAYAMQQQQQQQQQAGGMHTACGEQGMRRSSPLMPTVNFAVSSRPTGPTLNFAARRPTCPESSDVQDSLSSSSMRSGEYLDSVGSGKHAAVAAVALQSQQSAATVSSPMRDITNSKSAPTTAYSRNLAHASKPPVAPKAALNTPDLECKAGLVPVFKDPPGRPPWPHTPARKLAKTPGPPGTPGSALKPPTSHFEAYYKHFSGSNPATVLKARGVGERWLHTVASASKEESGGGGCQQHVPEQRDIAQELAVACKGALSELASTPRSARLSKLLQGAAADAGATVDEKLVTVDEKTNKVRGQLVAQQPATHKPPADKSRRKSASGFTFGELMSFFKKLPAEAEAQGDMESVAAAPTGAASCTHVYSSSGARFNRPSTARASPSTAGLARTSQTPFKPQPIQRVG